jgi:hypothetical protein
MAVLLPRRDDTKAIRRFMSDVRQGSAWQERNLTAVARALLVGD